MPKTLNTVSHTTPQRLPFRSQPYCLTLHVPYTKEADLAESRAEIA